jgi:hypothetical protein
MNILKYSIGTFGTLTSIYGIGSFTRDITNIYTKSRDDKFLDNIFIRHYELNNNLSVKNIDDLLEFKQSIKIDKINTYNTYELEFRKFCLKKQIDVLPDDKHISIVEKMFSHQHK